MIAVDYNFNGQEKESAETVAYLCIKVFIKDTDP